MLSRFLMVTLALAPAGVGAVTFGASLGLLLPVDRLTARPGLLGTPIRPGPSLGFRLAPAEDPDGGMLSWDVSAELAQCESDADPALRTIYAPVKGGLVLRAATVRDVGLEARLAGGAALCSARSASAETDVLPVVSFGGALRRHIHRLSVALEFEAGALLERRPQAIFQVRLMLQTR